MSTTSKSKKQERIFAVALLLVISLAFFGCSDKKPFVKATHTKAGPIAMGPGGASGGSGDRNTVLQMPFDNVAKVTMMNIGRVYEMATVTNGRPPKNMEELGVEPRNLKTKRDMQDRDIEVIYGVDVNKLGEEKGNFVLAWEKTPDNGGKRLVLMADYFTVKYVTTPEFEAMKKAK